MKRLLQSWLWLVLAALIAGVPGLAAAQEGSAWRITSVDAVPAADLVPSHMLAAPDGRQVFYQRSPDDSDARQACVQTVASGEERCFDLPLEFPYPMVPDIVFPPIAWSPDSTQIAAVGYPYRFLKDSDLSVIDMTTGETRVLIDDGLVGSLMFGPEPLIGASIESEPAWAPDSASIAFERAIVTKENLGEATISVLDLASGEIRELTRLPGAVKGWVDAGSTLGIAWSPDQTTLAICVRHAEVMPDKDGLWLVDVASGKLVKIASFNDLNPLYQQLFPEAEILAPLEPAWSPDGAHLLFWLGNPGSYEGAYWPFVLDLKTREIAPVPLPLPQGEARFILPRQAVWSPDGASLLVSALPLGALDSADLADPLDPAAETSELMLYLIDLASGEHTALGSLPQVPSVPTIAIWAPTNNVLIDGYHLVMENS